MGGAVTAFCECKDPPITFAGSQKNEPFCKSCLRRVEVRPAYEPDPERWQDRKFIRKETHGIA